MTRRGRPVRGAVFGFLLGIFISLDLMMFNVRTLDTLGVVVIPVAGLVLGILIGLLAPFGRSPQPPTGP